MTSVPRRRVRWLSANLIVLTVISLLQDMASELLYPLLPLLIVGVLAAPPVVLGVIEGLADATAGLTKYAAGRWSDRRGRKPFIGAGYGLAAVGKVLVAAAVTWPVVLVGRVVDRFGKGVRSAPRDALIADSVPREALGRAFGFHRAGDSLGAVIGPLIGLALLTLLHDDLRAALWWAVVPATASALLVLAIREHPRRLVTVEVRTDRAVTTPAPAVVVTRMDRLLARSPLPRSFWRVTILLVAIALLNFSDALVLLRLMDIGFSTTEVILAYVLFNVVYTVAAYPAGALSDRIPRPIVYALGLVAFAIGYGGLGLISAGPWIYVLIAVYGLFPALTDGVGKAWISDLVDDEHRGRAQGVFQALMSGSVLIAGVWAGLSWTTGPGAGVIPLLVSGIGAASVALVMLAALTVPALRRRRSLSR